MKKTFPITRAIAAVLLLCMAVFGVYISNFTSPLHNVDKCDFTTNSCELIVFNKPMSVTFEQQPITEEELFLVFDLDDSSSIVSAWVEGTDMYMGKTPVLFEDPLKPLQAVTFLGSCNLQEMQWQLNVKVKNNATAEVALIQLYFYTYAE